MSYKIPRAAQLELVKDLESFLYPNGPYTYGSVRAAREEEIMKDVESLLFPDDHYGDAQLSTDLPLADEASKSKSSKYEDFTQAFLHRKIP